jgi:RNA polymerase sigma factor (sigma-70 family)
LTSDNVISFESKGSPRQQFEGLLRPHFEALYSAARRMALSQVDAEDLVQEVCIKVFLRFDEFKKIEYRRAWLLKMLYHQFIDLHRSNQRSPVGNSDTGVDSVEPEKIAESEWQPEQMVDRDIRIAQVLRAMKCLSQEHCALVALHDIEGLTLEELHKLTGHPVGTIKSLLHRTRVKLGRLLANESILKPQLKAVGGKS